MVDLVSHLSLVQKTVQAELMTPTYYSSLGINQVFKPLLLSNQ